MHFLLVIPCCLLKASKSLADEVETSNWGAEPATGTHWWQSHPRAHHSFPRSGLAQASLEMPCGGTYNSHSHSACAAGPPAITSRQGMLSTELNTTRTCCPLLHGPFARQVAFHWVKCCQDAAAAASLESKLQMARVRKCRAQVILTHRGCGVDTALTQVRGLCVLRRAHVMLNRSSSCLLCPLTL